MLDNVPEAKQAYVQKAEAQETVLDRIRRNANLDSLDNRQKKSLERALQGIYQRGYQAFLPENSLPIFTAKDGEKALDTHILRHGTFTESVGLGDYSERYDTWIDKKELADINDPKQLTGQAWVSDHPSPDGVENCVVTTHIKTDSPYQRFTQADAPLLFPTNMLDLYMEAHESEHCLYRIDFGDETTDHDYLSSVREVSADLSAALNYARSTGNFDIYPLLIRPMRLVNPGDMGHTTAYALNEMLRQLDPEAIKGMDAKEIPSIVQQMMVENFEDGLGHVLPLSTPNPSLVMREMSREFQARKELESYRFWGGVKDISKEGQAYAKSTLMSLQRNHQAFMHLIPDDLKTIPLAGYERFVDHYKLQEVDQDVVPDLSLQPPKKDSKLDGVLDRMMGL